MARYPNLKLPSPQGMGSALDPADLPLNKARLVRGFTPARNGRLQLSKPLERILETATDEVVTGVSYYYNPFVPSQAQFNAGHYRLDRLVVVKNGVNVYVHSVSFDQSIVDLVFGPPVHVGDIPSVKTGGVPENQNIRTVQYKDEMFMVAGDGSTPMRLFVDATDTAFFYKIGIVAPAAVTAALGAAGNVNGDVIYYTTEADEKDRESSPSDPETITATNDIVNLTFAWGTDPQIVTKYIYRSLAGGVAPFYRIASITNKSTTTYADNALDANITSNPQMPPIGSNEPPKRASAIELHKTRLFMNNRNIYDDLTDLNSLTQLQMSNLDAIDATGVVYGPTQFNLVPANIAENSILGLQMLVGNRNSDELTGLKSNGSVLAIPSRQGMHHLYGDDVTSFFIRYQHDVGNTSIDSFVEGDGRLYWCGVDGFYLSTFEDGFTPKKMTLDIDNIFNGNILRFSPAP